MSSYHELSRGLDVNVRFSGCVFWTITVKLSSFPTFSLILSASSVFLRSNSPFKVLSLIWCAFLSVTYVCLSLPPCGQPSHAFRFLYVPIPDPNAHCAVSHSLQGWLPDPTSPACSLVKFSSYNHLAEKIFKARDLSVRLDAGQKVEPVASSSSEVDAQVELTEQDRLDAEHGRLIEQWMKETSSQLTFYGLTKLHEELQEGQLYVFFRNNHFSTLLMREASLWLLVTDQGFTKQAAVWEKLDTVDGDSVFVTSSFEPFEMGHSRYSPHEFAPENDSQTSMDEQLAQQLQEAEHRKAERSLAQSQKAKKSAPPPSSNRSLNKSAPAGPPQNTTKEKKDDKSDDDCCIL